MSTRPKPYACLLVALALTLVGCRNERRSANAARIPTAPTDVAVTVVSRSQIEVTWTDGSDDEDGFHVERSTDNASWQRIASVGAGVTRLSNTGLDDNTLYFYRVAAFNQAGSSRYSAVASATSKPVWPFSIPIGGPNPTPLNATDAFPGLRFIRPVFATHAPDGSDRIFVVEQAGRILVFPNDPATTVATVYLDIQSLVTSSGEQGLLGLAFHPDYASNGLFYVYYTRSSPTRQSVLASFRVSGDPDVADGASHRVLLTIDQPFPNHNAGMIAFGPDDMLYISVGDGGGGGDPFGNAQDLTTLLGSVLRINPGSDSYSIPDDNPYIGAGGGVREEIWAHGFRNPWRFSFDRQTGEHWLGDVGQSDREEVDIVVRGGNYGWNVFEGNRAFDNPQNLPSTDFQSPVIDYDSSGNAVVGGYVYRGSRLTELRGAYIHSDYLGGSVWAVVRDGASVTTTEIAQVDFVSAFGEDQHGELLIVSHVGTIYRLEPAGAGNPFPSRLSDTGLFTDVVNLVPAPGLFPYEINSPLWSDGSIKRRWLAAPLAAFGYHPGEAWSFPVGSVLVKHFELETVLGDPLSRIRLETRVLVREQRGWAGYTYKWNPQQTDAELLGGRVEEGYTITDPAAPGGQRRQTWTYPSRTDCSRCHSEAGGRVLGVRTRQLNLAVQGESQMDRLAELRLVEGTAPGRGHEAYPDPADRSLPYADRARSYLAVNCAICHLPGGPAPTDFDLRWGVSEDTMNLIDARPTRGDLGLPDAWLVRPGEKESSVLWQRMRRLDATRMPPLASHEPDPLGIEVVGGWIDGLR